MWTVAVESSLKTIDSWSRLCMQRLLTEIHRFTITLRNPVTKNIRSKYRFTVHFLQLKAITSRTDTRISNRRWQKQRTSRSNLSENFAFFCLLIKMKLYSSLMSNTHCRRDETVELRRVGGVNTPVGSRDQSSSIRIIRNYYIFGIILTYFNIWNLIIRESYCGLIFSARAGF